jgi:predicted glycoside hydrolase/deacetylase ChbG (UPF0249 family)
MGNLPKKLLIINADDFGLLPEVNQGIIECFESESITSTTLMVNTDGVQDAVNLAKKHPSLGVGLHFNLTQGKPISSPNEIPSLVDHSGNFHSRSQFEKKIILGKISLSDLKKEFAAQYKRFKDWGLEMTHIDSHHHIHVFPSVFRIASNYARKMALPLRVPWVSYGFVTPTIRLKGLKSLIKKLLLNGLTLRLSNESVNGIVTPDKFISIHDYIPFPLRIERRHYADLINSAPAGTTEIMVHPAQVTTRLEHIFSDAWIKAQERKVLTRLSLIKLADKFGFIVATYRSVPD